MVRPSLHSALTIPGGGKMVPNQKGDFMKHCISCGTEIADNAKSCPKCGCVLEKEEKGRWARVLGIVSLVFAILGTVLGLLSLIPLLGLILVYPTLVIGGLTLIVSIVCCIFASRKGVCITGIVFSSVDVAIAVIRLIMLFSIAAAA